MRHILIVEREGLLRGLLVQRFEQVGFNVQTVASPTLARRVAARYPPDLIIWNLDMEDDGDPCSEGARVRGHPLSHPLGQPGTPVIYLTSRGGEAPFPSLRKPFRPAHLLSLAQLSLQLRHTQNFGIVPIS